MEIEKGNDFVRVNEISTENCRQNPSKRLNGIYYKLTKKVDSIKRLVSDCELPSPLEHLYELKLRVLVGVVNWKPSSSKKKVYIGLQICQLWPTNLNVRISSIFNFDINSKDFRLLC